MSKKTNLAAVPTSANTDAADEFLMSQGVASAAPLSDSLDKEIGRLVDEFEASLPPAPSAPALLPSLVNADTVGVLVLFAYRPGSRKEGKVYPVMRGHLDTRGATIPVSAFLEKSEEGREYLSLSIAGMGYEPVRGSCFRAEQQNPDDGTWGVLPGKGNDRFGFIEKSVKVGDEYETVFRLRFFGGRKVAANGLAYIKAKVYSQREEVSAESFSDCF